MSQDLNATITKRINTSEGLAIFHVKPDQALKPFKAGQYVALGLFGSAPRAVDAPKEIEPPRADKIVKRSYSIGSDPSNGEEFEFYIAIVPDGALTSRLDLLGEGGRLWMAPKVVGKFTVDEAPQDANLVFVSTGTGIAPYIAMLRSEGLFDSGRKITLMHGVRYKRDLAYREMLEELAQKTPQFNYLPIASREDWEGERGYVQQFFKDETISLDSAKDHVFLCGNPAMIDEVTELLGTKGYSVHSKRTPGNLHLEKYW